MPKKNRPDKAHYPLIRGFIAWLVRLMFSVRYSLRLRNIPSFDHPCVLAIYHDEILLNAAPILGTNMVGMASRNHFGKGIGQYLESCGNGMVYGSPSKGGQDAIYELNACLKDGRPVMIAVDGSRGPRHEIKAGVVVLAKKAKVPLYLMRAKSTGIRFIWAWDKFLWPLPFAKVEYLWEEFPLQSRDAEGNKISLKTQLAQANARMDAMIDEI